MLSRQLSKLQHKTLSSAAAVLIPGQVGMPAAERDVPVADTVMPFLENLPRRQLIGVRLGLAAFELSPLAAGRRRFSKLKPEQQLKHLKGLAGSRFALKRDLILMIKVFCSLGYGRDPRVQEKIGYSSECKRKSGLGPAKSPVPKLNPEQLAPVREDIECDVAVIGSGAGGAVAAYELAKAGANVAVIEAGSYHDRRSFSTDPLTALPQLYRDQGLTVLEGRPAIPVPVGRCVGGTTVINSGTCFRAPEDTLKSWREEYGVEWADLNALGPVFSELERNLLVEPVDLALMGQNGTLCKQGAEAIGANGGPISRYAADCSQCSSCPTGCQIDIKQATHISYMPRAVASGAKLFIDTEVVKIERRNGGVSGVTVKASNGDGSEHTIKAEKVVLAAGTIGTPELLLRSGFGQSHPQVGHNLRAHPACWVGARFEQEVKGWQGIMQSYYVDQWHHQNVLLEATFTPLPFAGHWLPGVGTDLEERLLNFGKVGSIGVHLSDTSKGRVKLNRRGETVLTYKLNKEDVGSLLHGIARASEIHFAAGAKEVYPHVGNIERLLPGEQSKIEYGKFKAHELRLEAFHPMGTARFGQSTVNSVCNRYGQVHGVANLYVCDASLFPTSLGVNPMMTIMAFSTLISRRLAED